MNHNENAITAELSKWLSAYLHAINDRFYLWTDDFHSIGIQIYRHFSPNWFKHQFHLFIRTEMTWFSSFLFGKGLSFFNNEFLNYNEIPTRTSVWACSRLHLNRIERKLIMQHFGKEMQKISNASLAVTPKRREIFVYFL